MEVSAKTGMNINESFHTLAREMLLRELPEGERIKKKEEVTETSEGQASRTDKRGIGLESKDKIDQRRRGTLEENKTIRCG